MRHSRRRIATSYRPSGDRSGEYRTPPPRARGSVEKRAAEQLPGLGSVKCKIRPEPLSEFLGDRTEQMRATRMRMAAVLAVSPILPIPEASRTAPTELNRRELVAKVERITTVPTGQLVRRLGGRVEEVAALQQLPRQGRGGVKVLGVNECSRPPRARLRSP